MQEKIRTFLAPELPGLWEQTLEGLGGGVSTEAGLSNDWSAPEEQ